MNKCNLKFSMIILLFISIANAKVSIPKAQEQPLRGGHFRTSLIELPQDLSPFTSNFADKTFVIRNLYESLLKFDYNTSKITPLLAKSYLLNKKTSQVQFTIRKKIFFHNNEPMTPQSIKNYFEYMKEKKFPKTLEFFDAIQSIKIHEDQLIFQFKKLTYELFRTLGTIDITPLSYAQSFGQTNHKFLAIGTGPYKLKEYSKQGVIVLERNSKWWGDKVAPFQSSNFMNLLTFKVYQNENIRTKLLERGELDLITRVTSNGAKAMKGSLWGTKAKKISVPKKILNKIFTLTFNMKSPVFKNQKTREAFYYLINRNEIVKKLFNDTYKLAQGPFFVGSPNTPLHSKTYEFNEKKGLNLLREAGWRDSDRNGILEIMDNNKNVTTEFKIDMISYNDGDSRFVTRLRQTLKKYGILINIRLLEGAKFLKVVREAKNFDASYSNWTSHPTHSWPRLWHSKEPFNAGYSSRKADQLIEKLEMTFDKKSRIAIYHELHHQILKDTPTLFLFSPKFLVYAVSNRVQTKEHSNPLRLSEWWLSKPPQE